MIFFCLKSKSLGAPFFSKHLFIHGIVNNSACERLGEDWYHNIITIRCFRVAKSGVFEIFFCGFQFSLIPSPVLGLFTGNKHGLKITDIKFDFSGGQKNRGSSRVEDKSPQLEMTPYFFFQNDFFCLKSKSLAAPFFSKHLFIHGIVNNSACERLGEDWYHNIIKNKCFRAATSGVFKKFLRISIFSKSIACFGIIYRKQTWA